MNPQTLQAGNEPIQLTRTRTRNQALDEYLEWVGQSTRLTRGNEF